ncbi:hypothetical protein CL634_03195 [bacterium]|nr:hypothetical protein [bacterium]
MNVSEASIKLFTWYSEHDSFEMEKNFLEVMLVSDGEAQDKAAINCALKDLEEGNLIQSSKIDEREIWTLQKPFSSFSQTVEISADLALALSEAINEFCEAIEDKTDLCVPTSIIPKDIQNLVFLYRHLQEKLVSEEKEGI